MREPLCKVWNATFNKCVISFTGRKKVDIDELEPILKESGPFVTALETLDKIDIFTSEELRKKNFKAFVAANKQLKKVAKVYSTKIDLALKAVDKAAHPQIHKDIKLLSKQIDAFLSEVDAAEQTHTNEAKKQQNNAFDEGKKQRAKLQKQGFENQDLKEKMNYFTKSRVLVSFPVNGKKALSDGALAIQKLKADPTPATYNSVFSGNGPGRVVSTQFLNVSYLVQHADAPADLKQEMSAIRTWDNELGAFGDGAKNSVAPNATKELILERAGEFKAMLVGLTPLYTKLCTYLKKHKI